MLLPVFYIAKEIDSSKRQNEDITFCYPASLFKVQESGSLNKLFTNQESNFCILIDGELSINTVIRILFHPLYFNVVPLTPCFLVSENLPDKNRIQEEVTRMVMQQGFLNPLFFELSMPFATNSLSVIVLDESDTEQGYLQLLKNKFGQCYGLAVNLVMPMETVVQQLNQAEQALLESDPVYYGILLHAKEVSDNERRLSKKNFQLESRLKSLAQYDFDSNENTSFTSQQVKAINEFYKYEYEILPKWYKQFGHILKVMMGKINFKSLFRDNVKKYNR